MLLLCLLYLQAASAAHPEIILRDAKGSPLVETGQPFSPTASCAECHDLKTSAADHALAPLSRPGESVWRHPGGQGAQHGAELDCLLCHAPPARGDLREKALAAGDGDWAASMRFVPRGALINYQDSRFWNLGLLRFDGTAPASLLQVEAANQQHCQQCHQSATAVGDVHETASVGCLACHMGAGESPHQLQARSCNDCHDPSDGHDWLPLQTAHFEKLACTSCHIPELPSGMLRVYDRTLPSAWGDARQEFTNPGELPHLLAGTEFQDPAQLAPYQRIMEWYWGVDEPKRVLSAQEVADALWKGNRLPTTLGQETDIAEQWIQSPAGLEAATVLLAQAGHREIELGSRHVDIPLGHGIKPAALAVRACSDCHGADTRWERERLLAERVPGQLGPLLTGSPPEAAGVAVARLSSLDWLGWRELLILTVLLAVIYGYLLVRSARQD